MPCNSDYLEPSERDKEKIKAAKLLIYVCEQLGLPVPKKAIVAESDVYGDPDCIPELCKVITDVNKRSKKSFTALVTKNTRLSHELAIFWEDHKGADKRREAQARDKIKRRQLQKSGLAKLTKAERLALRVALDEEEDEI